MSGDIEKCKGCHKEFFGFQLCTNEETKRRECLHCYVIWRQKKKLESNTITKHEPKLFCDYCNRHTREMYIIPRPKSNGMIYKDRSICGFCMNLALKRMATK